jgi:hypothetical protein
VGLVGFSISVSPPVAYSLLKAKGRSREIVCLYQRKGAYGEGFKGFKGFKGSETI